MKIHFAEPKLPKEGVLVVGVFEGKKLTKIAQEVDGHMKKALLRAIETSRFQGKKEEILSIAVPQELQAEQLIVVGLGKGKDLEALDLEEIGARIAITLSRTGSKVATIVIPQIEAKKVKDEIAVAYLANGFLLRSWDFDKYKTQRKAEEKSALKEITFASSHPKASQAAFSDLEKVTDAVLLTRTLVNEPANVINPETLAKEAEKLKELGVAVEVFGEKELRKMGLNALVGVGVGSQYDSKLVILEWKGGKKGDKPIAIVGKGVTFDSGGLSIKPAAGMEEMKCDMGGSGVVLGLMQALAARKAKVNVVGVMGLVENMPSGTAQRPGDVVKSLSGQTIEILNTDAEGRLVLADALWYTQDRFKPQVMIDLATLTGAIIVSLGYEYAGLFTNDEGLAKNLTKAGLKTGEKLWQLPMSPAYDKEINSEIADVKNVGSGRGAGSITAAQFLQRFVNKVPWAHLDIAATAFEKKDQTLSRKGGTGFGVRLLNQWIEDVYENR